MFSSPHNPNKDHEVTQPPNDSISSLSFSPTADFLVAGSWDNAVRCWEIKTSGTQLQSNPKAEQQHTGPVLDCCWSADGTKVFTGSGDKTAKMWDLNTNQFTQVAAHDAPVKSVNWIQAPNYQCLMTGSWDKTLKFWDTRTAQPMMSIQCEERVYASDVVYPMAVSVLAGKKIKILNLENQPTVFNTMDSPLKYQLRDVSIFKKDDRPFGFGVCSIEGRAAIEPADSSPANVKYKFTFKCHRTPTTNSDLPGKPHDIYSVNAIKFHPVYGTLATVGSDGKFCFWDKDARTKLKGSEQLDNTITCCDFNNTGSLFAYASSYDWSKGHEFHNPQQKNYIFVKNLKINDELKPRKPKT